MLDDVLIGTAQVHTTLALAAATAMASDFGNRRGRRMAPSRWHHHDQLTSVTPSACQRGFIKGLARPGR